MPVAIRAGLRRRGIADAERLACEHESIAGLTAGAALRAYAPGADETRSVVPVQPAMSP